MTIKLPSDLDGYVKRAVASGQYASADEVLAHALEVLREVEAYAPQAEAELRREIDLGLQDIAEGRVTDWDVEELKRHIIRNAKSKKAS
jgi:antitoxin ParD1/3/4